MNNAQSRAHTIHYFVLAVHFFFCGTLTHSSTTCTLGLDFKEYSNVLTSSSTTKIECCACMQLHTTRTYRNIMLSNLKGFPRASSIDYCVRIVLSSFSSIFSRTMFVIEVHFPPSSAQDHSFYLLHITINSPCEWTV